MRRMLAVVLLGSFLAGCAVHTREGSLIVDPPSRHGGGFCPPGQAKKGNC